VVSSVIDEGGQGANARPGSSDMDPFSEMSPFRNFSEMGPFRNFKTCLESKGNRITASIAF